MHLFAPEYYKDFNCISDKCHHSCCAGWEIDIDAEAVEKYRACRHPYANKITESIEYGDTPHFRLDENERCPHLNESGLCRIILEIGEDHLCDICKEHPRFYNRTKLGIEVGLGMACEEACRLILSSDGYMDISTVGIVSDDEFCVEFDTPAQRAHIFSILSDRTVEYSERLKRLYTEYEASPAGLSDGEWRDLIRRLEFIDENDREAFLCYTSDTTRVTGYENELERMLAYLIYRHTGSAECRKEFIMALGFAFFTERLFASLIGRAAPTDAGEVAELARRISCEIEYSEENTEVIEKEFI